MRSERCKINFTLEFTFNRIVPKSFTIILYLIDSMFVYMRGFQENKACDFLNNSISPLNKTNEFENGLKIDEV